MGTQEITTIRVSAMGYIATLEYGGIVTITDSEGHYLGDGNWRNRAIYDCDASLGDGEIDEGFIYDRLEEKLLARIEKLPRNVAECFKFQSE